MLLLWIWILYHIDNTNSGNEFNLLNALVMHELNSLTEAIVVVLPYKYYNLSTKYKVQILHRSSIHVFRNYSDPV